MTSDGRGEGELRLFRYDHPISGGNPFKIERADPVVRINAELVKTAKIATDIGASFVSLDGDVLTIEASNRTVVYVIDRDSYDHATDSYRMRWPD